MRITVVTPHRPVPEPWYRRCLESVARQTRPCTHLLVGNDVPPPPDGFPGVRVLRLPAPQGTVCGALAVGAVAAVAGGAEAVAFLDPGGWYEPRHLELLAAGLERFGGAVASSARRLIDRAGAALGPDPDVDGETFAAADCLLLARPAFGALADLYLLPHGPAETGDRTLWQAILRAGLRRVKHPVATVNSRAADPARPARIDRPLPAAHAGDPGRTGPRVSLCVLAQGAEDPAACLEGLDGLFDEVLILRPGPADRPGMFVLPAGARLVPFDPVEDRAAARNELQRHAAGEWVFWLDAGERVGPHDRRALERLLRDLPDNDVAYVLRRWSERDPDTGTGLVVDQPRLFRRRPPLRWQDRAAPQLLPALRERGAKLLWTDLTVHHRESRATAEREGVRERRLLELDLADRPADASVLLMLASTLLDGGDPGAALPYLLRGRDAGPAAGLRPKAHALLARGHRLLARPAEALREAREGLRQSPADRELWSEAGLALRDLGDLAGARDALGRALGPLPRGDFLGVDPGLGGYRTRHYLAQVCRRAGEDGRAEELWRAAVRQLPAFGPAWLGLAELYLDSGRGAEVAALLGHLEDPQVAQIGAAVRARAALAAGDHAGTCQLLDEAISRTPESSWLRRLRGFIPPQEAAAGSAMPWNELEA